MSEIITEHNGIKIKYNAGTNQWEFELRGRCRSVDSLVKAQEIIEKPPPKKAKPFTRLDAWILRYSHLLKVTVTSVADERYGGTRVWISGKDETGRAFTSKEPARSLFPCNERNDKLVAERQELTAEIETLRRRIAALDEKLTVLVITPEPEE